MQRILFIFFGVLLGLILACAQARAYTPESGVWWNPAEEGSGLQIEIQDNLIAVFVYAYDSAGNATWYTSTGFLTGNALYEGTLDAFTDGQPIDGSWRPNNAFAGAGGPIRIVFDPDDPTRATLTWGGRTKQIERYHFYLRRPEDRQAMPGVRVELTKMLGEWQATLDFTDANTDTQYFGELVILDLLTFDEDGDFVEGCRAADSQVGFCSNADVDAHRAIVVYTASTDSHVLLVDNSPNTWAAYFIQVGTNDFRGEVSVYPKGTEASGFHPVRGFRSASRSFVQEGVGPSKSAATDARPTARGLPLTTATAKAEARQLDAETLQLLRTLEARLGSERTR